MDWTEEKLARLPEKAGFRLRGENMTRIEVFSDAAFAFAVTMLVVSLSSIPENFEELVEAIKGVPAFAASFACIMVFWAAHRSWSRRFGLEDGISTTLTLSLIFIILIYVYPLKIMMTSWFYWMSGGWLPSKFVVSSPSEMTGLIIFYGVGVAAVAGIQMGLYLRVKNLSDQLLLSAREQIRLDLECATWLIHVLVSLLSVVVASIYYKAAHGYLASFIYLLLPLCIPFILMHYKRKERQLNTEME